MAALLKVGLLTTLEISKAVADDGSLNKTFRLLLPSSLVLEVVVSFDRSNHAGYALKVVYTP